MADMVSARHIQPGWCEPTISVKIADMLGRCEPTISVKMADMLGRCEPTISVKMADMLGRCEPTISAEMADMRSQCGVLIPNVTGCEQLCAYVALIRLREDQKTSDRACHSLPFLLIISIVSSCISHPAYNEYHIHGLVCKVRAFHLQTKESPWVLERISAVWIGSPRRAHNILPLIKN
ncbi:hypothetical protein BD779DRAFT_1790497 [Infundibulicybe gibba]|nr:hypothetical protein BD779DRAFT_1790497 [Infundibulicybe gibba]